MAFDQTTELLLPQPIGTTLGSATAARPGLLRPWLRFGLIALFLSAFFVVVEFKLVVLFDHAHSWSQIIWKIYGLITSAFLLSRFAIVLMYEDDHTTTYPDAAYPSVSIIIAAKNEEESMYRTIATSMQSTYPGWFECIAVNDGSTDGTGAAMARAKKDFQQVKGGVKVITFEKNQGKREGMAAGALVAKGNIFVFIDSDSFVQPTAIQRIVEHFLDDRTVGAVAGNTGVENVGRNLLTKMQSARYGVSYEIFKTAESVFGTVSCCSGCFSAYRAAAMMPVLDQWRHQTFMGTQSTFGDDRSLTNYVLKTWKVIYCRQAKATTVVPEKMNVFCRQQLRWKKSWIREGSVAARFIWRKHPVAATSFYMNLVLPIFGPLVVFYDLIYAPFTRMEFPTVFIAGVAGMSLLFGMFYYLTTMNGYWWYVTFFSLLYVVVLIWQMPIAVMKLRDTRWGTR